jgi:hypothetical protein
MGGAQRYPSPGRPPQEHDYRVDREWMVPLRLAQGRQQCIDISVNN